MLLPCWLLPSPLPAPYQCVEREIFFLSVTQRGLYTLQCGSFSSRGSAGARHAVGNVKCSFCKDMSDAHKFPCSETMAASHKERWQGSEKASAAKIEVCS